MGPSVIHSPRRSRSINNKDTGDARRVSTRRTSAVVPRGITGDLIETFQVDPTRSQSLTRFDEVHLLLLGKCLHF
jgi:hypothetical protein